MPLRGGDHHIKVSNDITVILKSLEVTISPKILLKSYSSVLDCIKETLGYD